MRNTTTTRSTIRRVGIRYYTPYACVRVLARPKFGRIHTHKNTRAHTRTRTHAYTLEQTWAKRDARGSWGMCGVRARAPPERVRTEFRVRRGRSRWPLRVYNVLSRGVEPHTGFKKKHRRTSLRHLVVVAVAVAA